MTFSEKLKHLRKNHNLSQEELANKLNVSRQAISKWEMGTIPDIDNLLKISDYFGCSLDYLMRDSIEETTEAISTNLLKSNSPKSAFRIIRVISATFSCVSLLLMLIIKILSHIKYGDTELSYKCTIAFINNYELDFFVYSLLFIWFISITICILLPLFQKKTNKTYLFIRLFLYILFIIGTYIIGMELLSYGIIYTTVDIIFLFIFFSLLVSTNIYLFLYKNKV